MMEFQLQLVNSPMENNYIRSSRLGSYPPLGIAALAGYLIEKIPNCNLSLIDGEFMSIDNIVKSLNSEIIGISCNILTYKNALKIAESAFENGSKVIFGGAFPTALGESIIRNRPYISAVVVGDGEEAILKIVQGYSYENIPNIVYRKNGLIIKNNITDVNLKSVPMPNFVNLDLTKYFENFNRRYGKSKPFKKSMPYYSRKGCKWRERTNGGCIFCMIPHTGHRYRNIDDIWNEIMHYQTLGVDHLWDVSDTFTEDAIWIKDFASLKPDNCNIKFQIYGRPNHISFTMARHLKELGVYEVFIGAESGDDHILQNSNKGITTDQVKRAVEALAKYGLKTIISFVLGLPGETYQSLEKTVQFAEELCSYNNIVETSCSIMMPIPGSRAFAQMQLIEEFGSKYTSDLFDLEELKLDWIKHFTNVPYFELVAAQERINSLIVLSNSFSKVEWKIAPYC